MPIDPIGGCRRSIARRSTLEPEFDACVRESETAIVRSWLGRESLRRKVFDARLMRCGADRLADGSPTTVGCQPCGSRRSRQPVSCASKSVIRRGRSLEGALESHCAFGSTRNRTMWYRVQPEARFPGSATSACNDSSPGQEIRPPHHGAWLHKPRRRAMVRPAGVTPPGRRGRAWTETYVQAAGKPTASPGRQTKTTVDSSRLPGGSRFRGRKPSGTGPRSE